MGFRMPGHPIQEYPEDDKEKVNKVMNYLAEHWQSWHMMDSVLDHFGWKLDDLDKLALEEMLIDTTHVEVKPFGNLGKNQFKISKSVAVGVGKHGSYDLFKKVNRF